MLTLDHTSFSAPGDPIVFTVGLDSGVSLNGFDLTISWDPAELTFLSVADESGLGLDTVPVGATSAGERISGIELLPVSTDKLFSVTFELVEILTDGLVDLRVYADLATNGGGISPGGLALDNGAAGVTYFVPEPGTGILVMAALAVGLRTRSRLEPGERSCEEN
jgi:hypothetical protein